MPGRGTHAQGGRTSCNGAHPPNALAELQRDLAQLGFVLSQIREIEEARQKRLEQPPETGPHAMVRHRSMACATGAVRSFPPVPRLRAPEACAPKRRRQPAAEWRESDGESESVNQHRIGTPSNFNLIH